MHSHTAARFLTVLTTLALVSGEVSFAQSGQGFTGETHRKNPGKILWAKQRILKDMQDQITYATRFDATDPLYGRVFLANTLPLLSPNPTASYEVKVLIDGKDMGIINAQSFESTDWTTAQVTFRLTGGDEGDRQNLGVPQKWADIASGLAKGEHAVAVEFWGGQGANKQKHAEGSFTFVKAGEGAVASGSLPKPAMRDETLEASMLEALKARGWQNETPVKVVVVEPDWRIIRHPITQAIIRREINTNVALKHVNGKFRGTDISYTQQYDGSKYGRTEVYGIGMKNYEISAEEALK